MRDDVWHGGDQNQSGSKRETDMLQKSFLLSVAPGRQFSGNPSGGQVVDPDPPRFDPKDATAYNNRGHAHQAKGNYDKAIADFTEAIRLDPGFALCTTIGAIPTARRDYDKAIADLTEAIRLIPGVRQPTAIAAVPTHTRGCLTRPSPTTPRPSGSTPKTRCLLQGAAFVFDAKGEYDKAIADLHRGIRLDPEDRWPTIIAASLTRASTTRPSPTSTEAIRLESRSADVYFNRGYSCKGRRNTTRPSPTSRGHPARPKDALAYNNRGYSSNEKGDTQGHRRLQ